MLWHLSIRQMLEQLITKSRPAVSTLRDRVTNACQFSILPSRHPRCEKRLRKSFSDSDFRRFIEMQIVIEKWL